jgi:hypothetical protein
MAERPVLPEPKNPLAATRWQDLAPQGLPGEEWARSDRHGASLVPVLQPWEAATYDPEEIGEWGAETSGKDAPPPRHSKLAFFGVAVVAVLGGFIIWQSAPNTSATSPSSVAPSTLTRGLAVRPASERARQAADVARAFLATTTPEERTALVRHPEITGPRLLNWYTSEHPLRPLPVLQFHERWAEEIMGSRVFVMLTMEMADFTSRGIALEEFPDGSFKVDWESFEAWSTLPWRDYLTTAPSEPVEFRVIVEPDTYFNFSYADPARWLNFKLTEPATNDYCWGYCLLTSESAFKLRQMLRRQQTQGESHVKAIVRLRFEADGRGRRQVLIDDVLQDGWLRTEP